jgi:putative oxidoreductase
MNVIHKIEYWGDAHHPKILDILRILLGLLLMLKGYAFLNNAAYLRDLIIQNQSFIQSPDVVTGILYYTTYVHLVGGAMILLGLYTRLASIFQLPIMAGAILAINDARSYVNSELWLSIIVLALLVIFIIIGSGPISMTNFLSEFNNENDDTPDVPRE